MDLLTPHDLQQAMLAKSAEVDQALESYRQALLAWPGADRAARISMNTAMLTADGKSSDLRKAQAEQAAEEHLHRANLASAQRDISKSALNARLAQLSAFQSLATTVREEMRLAR